LVTTEGKADIVCEGLVAHFFTTGPAFTELLGAQKDTYQVGTSGKDVAVYQYTSGTSRQFPEAIKHYHRSIVTLMPAAVFGRGLRPGDRYFCPSPPAWGHGLWHGTLAPLALGIAVGAYSGKFDAAKLLEALQEFEIDNLGAMPTVYRMVKNSGLVGDYSLKINKMHYTGEPMDLETFRFLKDTFGVAPHSGYGSTEAGALIYHYAGFQGWEVKPGSLGKPLPGVEVALLDEKGNEAPKGQIGEIAVKRRGEWFRVKDAAYVDEDGYFWHKGRVDDIIISSGWTISPIEIEDVLKKHEAVRDVAVVGIPDKEKGEIVKAFVVTDSKPSPELTEELQAFVKNQLSRHEYPREIAYLESLPKTEAGKVKRKELREMP
jgi:acetyl-CoA synthetase